MTSLSDAPSTPGAPAKSEARVAFWLITGGGTDGAVVHLDGALDERASARLGAILTDLIIGQGNLVVAVDLRGLSRLDPAGVEVFAVAAAQVEARGGTLTLRGSPEEIVATLTTAGLTRLITFASGPGGPVGAAPTPTGRSRHPSGGARRQLDAGEMA